MSCSVNWEVVTGTAGVLIALCALGFTYWQVCVSRKHNNLSVMPYLTTWSNVDHEAGSYSIDIINNGVGPALIKAFKIYVDGQEVDGDGLKKVENALLILFPAYKHKSYKAYLSDGYMMASNEKRVLVKVEFLGPDYPIPDEVDRVSNRVKILINYESIYGVSRDYDSSKFKIIN